MMEDSNGVAIDPWAAARDRYIEDLSEDERALFANATIENIFYGASAAQKIHQADSKTRLAARKLKPFITALDQYGKALDVYSNASPSIMCPLWGSVRVVLQLAGDFEKYFAKLVDMFSRIGDVLPQFQAYTQLFPNHRRLLQVISIAYLDIVKFCVEAKDTFREGKLRGMRIAWKGIWKTFNSRFDDSLAGFRFHRENVEKEAMLSHMIEAGKARDLVLKTGCWQRQDEKVRQAARETSALPVDITLSVEESRRRLLEQLSSVDADYKHRKIRQLRHEGTGKWIRNTPDFTKWVEANESSCLSCHGIPGSGKTVLASSVLDGLLTGIDSRETAVAFYYCDYADIKTLTALSIFGTLVKQLLATVHIPENLEQLIDRCYANGTRTPDDREMLEILSGTLKLFSKVYLVIDGLDECKREERAVVLSSVKKLMAFAVPLLKIFMSSRDDIDTAACLEEYPLIYITEENISPDIALFITGAVDSRLRSGEIVVHSQDLRQEIITGLLEGARGMFLWVSFQLDDLCEATSDHDIRETLRNLPRDLAETYSRILKKIKNARRTAERLEKIQGVFKWIVCAERPLTIHELAEAIAIDTTDKCWALEKMSVDGERLIRHCGNLIVIDRETRAVRLAHYTVQQFLLSSPVDMSLASLHIDPPTATVQLGEACITYLSFSDFETQVTRRRKPLPVIKTMLLDSAIDQVPFGKRLVKDVLTSWKHVREAGADSVNPVIDLTNHLHISDGATSSEKMHAKYRFLGYAIDNWTWHTKGLTKENQNLWKAFATLALEKQTMFEFRPWGNIQPSYDFPHSTMFNWAIDAGHLALLRLTPSSGSNLRTFLTSQGQSSVVAAAKDGSKEVLEVLCKVSGLSLRDLLPIDEMICNAAAAGHDNLLEVLLQLDADPNTKSSSGKSALVCALLRRQQSTFRLLLCYGADSDLQLHKHNFSEDELWLVKLDNVSDQATFSLLYLAVKSGQTALTAALLEAGAHVDHEIYWDSKCNKVPLWVAVESGDYEMVKMLLEAKANVNRWSPQHPTVLQLACARGETDLVKLLLSAKANPNIRAVNVHANPNQKPGIMLPPALCEAAAKGYTEMVVALLLAKADTNFYTVNQMTALQAAAGGSHLGVVKALVAAKADVNLFCPEWPTALQAAARANQVDMVRTLLEAQADVNATSRREDMTPIQLAAEAGHSDVVEVLLAPEADAVICRSQTPYITKHQGRFIRVTDIRTPHYPLSSTAQIETNRRSL